MAVELDKDKLLEHLQKEMGDRWDKRKGRPQDLANWFYGPGPHGSACLRDMAHVYGQAYWDGVEDAIQAVLTFDDDIRGVEAVAAVLANMKAARS
jgi:hypothetical protein